MTELVTDLPIWADCPFRKVVSKHIEIRRGMSYGVDTVVFWDPVNELHVCRPFAEIKGKIREMTKQLVWAASYKLNGGVFAPHSPSPV